MPKLYTYCIPYDDGAAPNPYWGICTLVICKPVIRRAAEVGDWVVGTGSTRSPIGDIGGCVVYAMRVSRTMTMKEYDMYAVEHVPDKVPQWRHRDVRRRLGDALYDYSVMVNPPAQRPGVHVAGNVDTDLGGRNALLSDHFYYFGDHPVRLPQDLQGIVLQGQGHRSNSNAPYVEQFVEWIDGLGHASNTLLSKPQLDLFENEGMIRTCASDCAKDDKEDERIGESIC
jgi:hypothetical protein